MSTVYLSTAVAAACFDGDINIQKIVRHLRQILNRSDLVIATEIAQEYRASLNLAKRGNPGDHVQWLFKHQELIRKGEQANIPDVQGPLAIQEFLIASKA